MTPQWRGVTALEELHAGGGPVEMQFNLTELAPGPKYACLEAVSMAQDRSHVGDRARTPQWRGVTALHELHAGGVPTALASDNVRDQFYAYGDFDMLDVFSQVSWTPACSQTNAKCVTDGVFDMLGFLSQILCHSGRPQGLHGLACMG